MGAGNGKKGEREMKEARKMWGVEKKESEMEKETAE